MNRRRPRPLPPGQRMVLLGASNLTRCVALAVATGGMLLGEPVEALVAMGRGRSYGWRSSFFHRSLPAILDCGLWAQLAKRTGAPVAALVTDIGNDILYEKPVADIAERIERVVERLAEIAARTIVTRLPIVNLEGLSEQRYLFFRRLFMPMCRLSLDETAARARELDARVKIIARDYGASLVDQDRAWYDLDPLHIGFAQAPRAWRKILSPWNETATSSFVANARRWQSLRWQLVAPHSAHVCGVERRGVQPSIALPDGSTIAFY